MVPLSSLILEGEYPSRFLSLGVLHNGRTNRLQISLRFIIARSQSTTKNAYRREGGPCADSALFRDKRGRCWFRMFGKIIP